jgi:hypothetical protein
MVVIRLFVRNAWRLVVLLLGVVLAYSVIFIIYPYLDSKLPFFIVVLLVYIVVAYFGLPALIRTWRLLIRPDHIPLYVTTRDGLPSDPVNIAVVAKNRRHFIRTMQKAGWYTADKATLRNNLREAYAIVFNKPYPTAPFSNLLLFNRPFDLGFQMPYGKNLSPRSRHHVRFWQLREQSDDPMHSTFWKRHLKRFIGREKTIWIGAATDDMHAGGIRWYNLQLTHRTHPMHYRERDHIIHSLKKQKGIKTVTEIKAGEPFAMRGQNFGTSFVCDGRLLVVELQ